MNADDREKLLLRLCDDALAKDVRERAAFLDEACGGDAALRNEVESLLAGRAEEPRFLESPGWAAASAPLAAGTRLGPYEIQSFIGAGGMGQVYKARDTRLGRTIAIKVLPPDLAAHPDRRRRFEQEARAASALNDPHICTLYDIGSETPPQSAGGVTIDYLVMEYLDGETLAARLRKGRLQPTQALEYATQIADALSKAHRQRIVHRDLKPGNVMLTKSGAKLLDFGLAKLRAPSAIAGVVSSAPTREKSSLTAEGILLGTVPYMAPEQVEGKEADARSDIFSFGAVLYEMVTGKRAFEGESHASVIAAILEHEPAPLSSLQPITPPALDRLVGKCLQKDPDRRWQTAADVADELRWLASGSAATSAGVVQRAPRSRLGRWRLPLALAAALLAGGAAGVTVWSLMTPGGPPLVTRFELSMAGTPLGSTGMVAISPDGRTVAFSAADGEAVRLYLRRLDDERITPLQGTEDPFYPRFSEDGTAITFVAGEEVRRVPIEGGPAVAILKKAGVNGYDVQPDGGIAFVIGSGGDEDGLWTRLPTAGPQRLVPSGAGGVRRFFSPQMLPRGRGLLFTAVEKGHPSVCLYSFADRATKTIVPDGVHGYYVSAARCLVYQSKGSLYGIGFDPEGLVPTGTSFPLVSHVGTGDPWSVEFDVSSTGTLAYLWPPVATLSWFDRAGHKTPLHVANLPAGIISWVAISPLGDRAVLQVDTGPSHRLYSVQLGDAPSATRLSPTDDDFFGAFTPDGQRVLFTSMAGDNCYRIRSVRADGAGDFRTETDSKNWEMAYSAGRGASAQPVFLSHRIVDGQPDLWIQELGRTNTARPWKADKTVAEQHGSASPDGRWIAYISTENGRSDVYVQAWPEGSRSVVSIAGGSSPVWHPKGGQLFYQQSGAVFAVKVVDGRRVGDATKLFDFRPSGERSWHVMPDGDRFLVAEPTRPTEVHVITNWVTELRARVARNK